MSTKDKTNIFTNRTDINLFRSEIDQVIPEYFAEDYPNIKKLFDAYYEYMDSADNPSGQIQRLFSSRDATQVPTKLLQYLEDELLLGQAYFGGFLNKREAIKFSNTLYRSKGTKYSIEQFFRGFYGIDPTIIYPKENIFKVGPAIDYGLDSINSAGQQIKEAASVIGPESRKFITDDKLYQVMSVLIRIGLPLNEWVEAYKLFVHPGGVYLGSELLLELVNEIGLTIDQDEIGDPIEEQVVDEDQAGLDIEAFSSITMLNADSATGIRRQTTEQSFSQLYDYTFQDVGSISQTTVLGMSEPTMDDSTTATTIESTLTAGITMDNDLDSASVYAKTYDGTSQDTLSLDENGIVIKPTGTFTFDQHRFSTKFDSDNHADSANDVT